MNQTDRAQPAPEPTPTPGPWKAEIAPCGTRMGLLSTVTRQPVAMLGVAAALNPADVALLEMAPEMRHALVLVADAVRTAADRVRAADPGAAAQLDVTAGFALGASVIEPR